MDLLTLIGITVGVGSIALAQILEGAHLSGILQLTAAIIVFGGTMGAVLVNYPFPVVLRAIKFSRNAFLKSTNSPQELAGQIARLSLLARKKGLLSLESELSGISDPFLKRGLRLVVDGLDIADIREILETELVGEEENNLQGARVFESAGGYAPTIGILGAVLGLIQVMENLAEPSKLGEGMAVAFVATIYGVGSANLFWLPLAGKLKIRVLEESQHREMIIVGLTALARGENPHIIRERMEGFMTGSKHKHGG